jgi:serine/threonine protein phosphatase PrpC
VTLHFDRIGSPNVAIRSTVRPRHIDTIDQGAWSSKGKRLAQEDAFVLQEINNGAVLLAGVMDGHLGPAASHFVRQELPMKLSHELLSPSSQPSLLQTALESSWAQTCETYWASCENDLCSAEYDPREGVLNANTASSDAVAGTTTSVFSLDHENGELLLMNCGDSRTLVIDTQGQLLFQTTDHTPESEIERFEEGKRQGLDYNIPYCRRSKWRIQVGDYDYAVSRALEGRFATSKGVINTPDFTSLGVAEPGWSILSATDGLWEVMDSQEVARIVHKQRSQGMKASDIAKNLCSMAIKKGSSDNVSAVLVML